MRILVRILLWHHWRTSETFLQIFKRNGEEAQQSDEALPLRPGITASLNYLSSAVRTGHKAHC